MFLALYKKIPFSNLGCEILPVSSKNVTEPLGGITSPVSSIAWQRGSYNMAAHGLHVLVGWREWGIQDDVRGSGVICTQEVEEEDVKHFFIFIVWEDLKWL